MKNLLLVMWGPVAAIFVLCACSAPAQLQNRVSDDDVFRVTFVGTGGPEISVEREGIATLIQVGDRTILVDAGRNVMQNLYRAGIDPRQVTDILLTHLHNDHIEGLPTLWMTGWFLLGRSESLSLWGPSGTQAMVNGMYSMYQFDIAQRSNPYNDPSHLLIDVHEVESTEIVLESDRLIVRAFPVEHDDGDPAFGYEFESQGYRAVLTGDTRLTEDLSTVAKGADVVISNVLSMSDTLASKPEMQAVIAKLMTIDEAVELFNTAKPRLAVYSHFVGKQLPDDSDRFIEEETRAAGYDGALFLARDGWSVDVHTLDLAPPPALESLPDLDRKASYQNGE